MPIKVRCSQCQAVAKAPDQAAGKAVKCPGCGGRIKVPTKGGGSGARPAGAKKRKPTAARSGGAPAPGDDDFLSGMDLRNVEAQDERLCPRCGADVDVEDEICERCGTDLETGLLTEKARRKKERGGPDLDKYFEKLWNAPWDYLKRNKKYAIQSCIIYLISIPTIFFSFRMLCYSVNDPPKWFWSFIFSITALVPIGWTWFLATEVIANTMAKKKAIEKVNKNMVQNAALGLKAVNWFTFFTMFTPLIGLILATGDNETLNFVGYGLIGLAVIYAIPHIPAMMAHMTQPVQYKAWLPWILTKQLVATMKGSLSWLMQAGIVLLPVLIAVGCVIFFFGDDLADHFNDVNYNSKIATANPNAFKDNPASDAPEPEIPEGLEAFEGKTKDDLREIDWNEMIAPAVILAVAAIYAGFACFYLMRSLGLFSYYHVVELELVTQREGASWDESRIKRDEFGEVIDTRSPLIKMYRAQEGLFNFMIFAIVVGAIVYGVIFFRGE